MSESALTKVQKDVSYSFSLFSLLFFSYSFFLSFFSYSSYSSLILIYSSSKEDDKLSNDFNSYQELSEDEEDYYFDSMLEKLKLELQESQPPTIRIQNNSKLRFVRISGYQIVSDNENRKFCIFTLDIQCNTADPQTWKVYRRYSEFRKLSKILRSEGFYVPVMPPKSLFQTISSDFLSKRSVSISLFINFLCLISNFLYLN